MNKINVKLYYSFLILAVSFFIYFYKYYYPEAVFWDENYHIASAYKYLNNIMFMEPHPPLGKLFIALGEWLLHPNSSLNTDYFLSTDYIKHFPKGFLFDGVRLFPALFGTFNVILFFLILYNISKKAFMSFLFSSFYLFENGFVLQSRSAMLESTQIFFMFLSIYYFTVLIDKKYIDYKNYFIFGVLVGLTTMVKLNGLILVIMFLFLFFYKTDKELVKKLLQYGFSFFIGIISISLIVFYIHFSLGSNIGSKKYNASKEYIQILKEHKPITIKNYFIMLKDNIQYMANYSKNVPRYNPCKKGENGSLATTWPFINKTINYRWYKKDGKVSYLYLIGNPIIWYSVLVGIIISLSLVISRFIFGLKITNKRYFFLISLFLSMYLSYMFVMFNIPRVMYLYHYFIPLFFGIFILFSLYNYIFEDEIEKKDTLFYIATILFIVDIIYVFWYFSPFTYFEPLTTEEFLNRVWFDFWKMKPIL